MKPKSSITNKTYMIRLSIIFVTLITVFIYLFFTTLLGAAVDTLFIEYLILSAISILLTFMILEKLLHSKIIKPINELNQTMQQMIDNKNFNANIVTHSNTTEIDSLQSSFNQLINTTNDLQLKELTSSVCLAKELEFENILNQLPIAIVMIDENSKILQFNQLFQKLIGTKNIHENYLDDYFSKTQGYIYNDPFINWKELLLNFNDVPNKVLLQGEIGEFELIINLSKIKNNHYLVSLTQS